MFHAEHLFKLAEYRRAQEPVLSDTDTEISTPLLYRKLLVAFCTLAEHGGQAARIGLQYWPRHTTALEVRSSQTTRSSLDSKNILTNSILTVKVDTESALLGYLREEVDFTDTTINVIEDIPSLGRPRTCEVETFMGYWGCRVPTQARILRWRLAGLLGTSNGKYWLVVVSRLGS